MKPTPGRIVLFCFRGYHEQKLTNVERPAIVISVTDTVANMTVFFGPNDREILDEKTVIGARPFQRSVPMSKTGEPEPGAWRWPPRE
jgi:hypothetical protein